MGNDDDDDDDGERVKRWGERALKFLLLEFRKSLEF